MWDLLPELTSRKLALDLPHVTRWSFAQAPGFSKLSSWFGWNLPANSQIPDSPPAKMLHEYHLKNSVADLDDDPADSRNLRMAGRFKDT